jgi:hypothetical protein
MNRLFGHANRYRFRRFSKHFFTNVNYQIDERYSITEIPCSLLYISSRNSQLMIMNNVDDYSHKLHLSFFVFSSYLFSWYFSLLPNMCHLIVYYYTFQLSTSTKNCTIPRNLWHRIQKGKLKRFQCIYISSKDTLTSISIHQNC